ncbi:MAG: hypothetical protein WC389_17965, partial [Lutibacter sp.]
NILQNKRNGMNYPEIHKSKLTHAIIAKLFSYKNVNSFRCSTRHRKIMTGIEELIKHINSQRKTK